MRILVHEFASGGGMLGQEIPSSLAREGSAMRDALVEDLAALPDHRIITTTDPRFPLGVPANVEVHSVRTPGLDDTRITAADAVWLIAPEAEGRLEALARRVEMLGRPLLGPGSGAIRRASNKAAVKGVLRGAGLRVPIAETVEHDASESRWIEAASRIGYPVVVKPSRGAGGQGVFRVSNPDEMVGVAARAFPDGDSVLIEEWVRGEAASVSLLGDGHRVVPLSVNAQRVSFDPHCTYHGGTTPFDHPRADAGADAAVRACEALGGLRGLVGVDLILAEDGAVVIEVNPRLTTAYLGLRAAAGTNVAAIAVRAFEGGSGESVDLEATVSFGADGTVLSLSERSGVALR